VSVGVGVGVGTRLPCQHPLTLFFLSLSLSLSPSLYLPSFPRSLAPSRVSCSSVCAPPRTADKQTGMHYALDESLTHVRAESLTDAFERALRGPGLGALVLKPSLLGGFARCLWFHRLAPPGTQAVVSSAFESGLLLSHMAIMTAAVFDSAGSSSSTSHGLATFERLQEDLLVPTLAQQVRGGRLSVVRCERAVSSLVRTLDSHKLVCKAHGWEGVPALGGTGAVRGSQQDPPGAEDDEEASKLRRFGAV
jgi:hypothetical protein